MSLVDRLKDLLGIGKQVDYKALLTSGAQIVDVRTAAEYHSGHIAESLNIPLQSIASGSAALKKDKPVITCCASGIRSAAGKRILKSEGFREVYNGGSWQHLKNKIG